MSSYADMQTRIATDLRRTNLATIIPVKIQEAIRHFKDEPFWECEASFTPITSVIGTNTYALPADFSQMIGDITVTYNGIIRGLAPITIDELDQRNDNGITPLQGQPDAYNVFGSNFLVWPTPNQSTFLFNGRYLSNLAAPTLQTDSSFWTNEAQDLIAHYALFLLWQSVIRDGDKAKEEFTLAHTELVRLQTIAESRAYAIGRRVHVV